KRRAKLHRRAHLLLPLQRSLVELLRIPTVVALLKRVAELLNRTRHIPRLELRQNQRFAGKIREREDPFGLGVHTASCFSSKCPPGSHFGSSTGWGDAAFTLRRKGYLNCAR